MSAVIHLYETAHSGYYDDDPTRKINLVPKTWTKYTVTDGDWKTKYTINPLSARDEYIADCIEDLDSKVKIIVPGNNTTITTDNLGNEYINQNFQPSPDTIKIRSSQNTVTASVVTDELTKHTTVTLGLNPGTYNLDSLNWKFNTNLSANSFSSVGLTSTNANITTITGLTNVTATSFNPVTNLTAINLYTPNEFRISTNLSAIDLSAKDYIASDSFKIDGTAERFIIEPPKPHDYIPWLYYDEPKNGVYTAGIWLSKKVLPEIRELNQGRIFNPNFDGNWGEEDRFLGDELVALGYRIGYIRDIRLQHSNVTNASTRMDEFSLNFALRLQLRKMLSSEFNKPNNHIVWGKRIIGQ